MATAYQTRDAVCRRALRLIGAFASGETPDATSMQDCVEALTTMTKEWQASGIHVWTETEAFLALSPGQIQYALGPGSTDTFATGLLSATLAADASAGASAVQIEGGASVQPGYKIGLICGGTLAWFGVSGVTASAVSLTTPLPANVVAGTMCAAFNPSNGGFRPLRILSVRRSSLLSGIDLPLTIQARLDYQSLPNKMQDGTVNSWFYDPQIGSGLLSVWQAPTAPLTDVLKFTCMRALNSWDSAATIGDFPEEWTSALAYNLAVEVAPEYDVPSQRLGAIAAKAEEKKLLVQGFDREPESIMFGVSYDAGYR